MRTPQDIDEIEGELLSISDSLMKYQFVGEHISAYAPEKGSTLAAGFDLKADISDRIRLEAGSRVLVPTGIKVSMPYGYVGMVCSRSGLALKNGVFVLNAPGIIDADYTGQIGVILQNASDDRFYVEPGMRIAQLLFAPVYTGKIEYSSDNFEETIRGSGGFGSTGL